MMKYNEQSLVSIVLPTYNGSKYLKESIQSCLNQSHSNLELIIVDDGSSDQTPSIIKGIVDPRIKYVRFSTNQGHIAALNHGFSISQGEYLTWTSDDNYYALNAIECMLQSLKESKSDFVYTRYHVIDSFGAILRQGRSENPSYLDIDNCIGACFLYTRQVYKTIGDFSKEAFLAEDYEYWLRVRVKFKMRKLDDILYFYRDHEKSLTGLHKENEVQKQVQKIRQKHVPWIRLFYLNQLNNLRNIKNKILN